MATSYYQKTTRPNQLPQKRSMLLATRMSAVELAQRPKLNPYTTRPDKFPKFPQKHIALLAARMFAIELSEAQIQLVRHEA